VEHLGFERVSLLGFSCGGPPAVVYTALNPSRVDKLVFIGSYAFGPDLAKPKLVKALVDLVEAHWGLGFQTIADLFAPDLDKQEARALARAQHDWSSPELAARLLELSFALDCREAAARLTHPALVIHRRQDRTIQLAAGRDLAARLGDAEFVTLDGNAHVPWEGDSAPMVEAISAFLGAAPKTSAPPIEGADGHNVWLREGDLWRVCFAGRSVHLPHRKGLEDLSVLLANPMREIPAGDLASGELEPSAARPAQGSDAVLDERARAEFASRARAIESELAEAEAAHDLARSEALQAEREALLEELSAAAGLGGRTRRLNDPGERARKAVSARIRDSLKRIREVHPELADHLDASVTTGSACAYRPKSPASWRT
jgi:hypothetical protein